jgi:hypothetical protein
VGIALFSYLRTLSWGFTADWELFPDLHDLVTAVEHAFGELRKRAQEAPERPASPPPRKPRSRR